MIVCVNFMQRNDRCCGMARGVLMIGFCVQIVMGLIWMVLRFAGSLAVGESLFCIQGNELFAHLQCLVQLLLAFFAAYHFLSVVGPEKGERSFRLGGTLVLVTFPMAMQCHMSLGGESLVSSLLLLQTAVLVRFLRKRKGNGAEAAGRRDLLCASLLMIILIVVGFGERSGSTVTARVGSRLAWSSLNENYAAWPEELRAVLPEAKVREATHYADNFSTVLVPYLNEIYGTDAQGRQKVEGALWDIALIALESNTKGIVKEIVWDGLGYLCSPVVVQLQLAGYGYDSCTGVLYDNMRENYPRFSGMYLNYGCRFFGVAFLITWLWQLLEWLTQKKRQGANVTVALLPVCVSVLWYTLRGAGMMDYRKTIVVVLLYLAWIVSRVRKEETTSDGRKKCCSYR